MPFCRKCGVDLLEDAEFCPDCGTPVVKTGGSRKKQVSSQDFDDQTQARSTPQEYGKVSFDSIPEGYVISGRYEVMEKIGQGGFGAVYRCYDRNMEVDKALKVIPQLIVNDDEAMFDLQKEAKTMVPLNHPSILRVYDFNQTDDIKFIDMEYIDGKNLSQMKITSPDKQLPEAQVKEYAVKIAEGMAYAHSKGVLHKDLKPHNIKVTSDGSVKIMDFGIAETVRTSMSRLDHSSSSGTLVYMSPEQLRGKNVGREADIYSFGAMLYELLNGQPPFYRGDIKHQILEEKPEPLQHISDEMNSFLLKCLEKDYKKRFRSFNEVVSVLGGKTLPEQDEKIDEPQQKIAPEKEKKPDEISYADKTDTTETAKKSSIPTIPIAIGLAVLLIGIIAAVIISQSTVRIPVPDVVGMYYDEAEELLHQNGLTAQLRERQKSFTEPTNKVSAQFPSPGSEIRRRSAVRLNVYERWAKVPAVSDLTESAAKSRLKEAGFTVKEVASDFHPTIASERIIEIQDSPAELKEGSQVVLVKSKGIEMVDFPDLSGMSLAEAKAKLQSLGLRAGRESVIESNIDEAGRIVRTDPTSRRIAKGSRIELFVSMGAEAQRKAEAERQRQIAKIERKGFVYVEGGTFDMGANGRVTLSDFFIGKYPVTQREYQSVMENNPSSFKGDNLPVETVSWYDAIEYCNKLSIKEGLTPVYSINGNTSPPDWSSGTVTADWSANGYRLPTEAEWEYAARGGNKSRGFKYSGSNNIGDVAWYVDNSGENTHPVGTKSPNELDIYDMSGNVWEWCWDWFGDYTSGAKTNPRGTQWGRSRVLRGGSWYLYSIYCRVDCRFNVSATFRNNSYGFRVSRNRK